MSKTTSAMGRNSEADAEAAHCIAVYAKGTGADCSNATGSWTSMTKMIMSIMRE
jgi:hypothetical protein